MRPLFRSIQYTGVKQLKQTVLIREAAFGFGEFAELAMNSFDGVSGVDGRTNVLGIFKVDR